MNTQAIYQLEADKFKKIIRARLNECGRPSNEFSYTNVCSYGQPMVAKLSSTSSALPSHQANIVIGCRCISQYVYMLGIVIPNVTAVTRPEW